MVVQSLPLLLLVFISCAFANIANSSSSIPSLPARSFGFKFSVPVPQADDFDRLLSERSQAQAPDVSATSLPTLPNIGFLGSGYDLVAGNPETTNGDPGYRPARIFAASYTNQTTSDGRFLIFDGMDAIQRRTCSYDSECSEIHGETSYTNTLSCHVSVSASAGWSGFLSGSFSASSDYSSVSSSAYKDHEVSYLAKAVCTEYEASIQAFNPPPFSSNFLHAITKLVGTRTTNTNSTPICEKIVSSFGTHVITTVTMGSMFIVRSTFSDQSWSSLLDQKVDISLAARGSLKLFTGDASAGGSSALHAAQSFEAARSTFFSSFIGSRPSTDGKWETWAATTAESPHPVNHMTLMPLSDLVTPENFPEFSPGEVIAAAESLRSFIENWCQYNGGGERCTPKPDRSPTVTFTQSNSATDQVAFPCKSGLLLAAGFSARHGAVGPSHAAAPAFFAGNDGAAHCVAPSEVVECTALCSTGVTNVHRVWSPVVRGLVKATCPPGYLVASCSYLAAGGDEPFPLAYPSDPRSCSCYNYYGAQCGASCVPEAEVKAHEIVSRYGVGDFAASCPAGKRLLGCGYSREVAGQQEVYWRVAPTSNTACRCYNYFGATCHAVCAQY